MAPQSTFNTLLVQINIHGVHEVMHHSQWSKGPTYIQLNNWPYLCNVSHKVSAVKFNVLVTTYEFIMYDRSKLSRIDWKYIIIDEAQRMKDRESVLARDLDRYRCQRRLLLTGTPLQVSSLHLLLYMHADTSSLLDISLELVIQMLFPDSKLGNGRKIEKFI